MTFEEYKAGGRQRFSVLVRAIRHMLAAALKVNAILLYMRPEQGIGCGDNWPPDCAHLHPLSPPSVPAAKAACEAADRSIQSVR
jgi:hypothetical protein